MDVTVVVATFGDEKWTDLAWERAIPSAMERGVPVIYKHAATLHEARNAGLDHVRTEFVCHLDADDELEHGFFDAIATGTRDVRAPAVRYIRGDELGDPAVPRVAGHNHDCWAACLRHGNWLVVGSAARTALLRSVGGWRDWPMYEDWDLWARCWLAGATFEAIPAAVYRAHVRRDSRNRAPSQRARHAAHQAIADANGLPIPA